MLDTIFKTGSERRQAHEDLRSLVEQAREERSALEIMLARVSASGPSLVQTTRSLDELSAKTDAVTRRCDQLGKTVSTYDECARHFEQLEARMTDLLGQVADARQHAEALTAPDGGLQQIRALAGEMGSQRRDARAALDELQREGTNLEALRERLRQATAEMGQSVGHAVALKGEFDELRLSEEQLRREMQGIRKSAGEARADCEAANSAVAEMQAKLESLSQLQELSKSTEQRLASLNALAEHIAHKAKALEAQKQTVERAVVEATRLNEMVWSMDAQLAKLTAGGDQIQRAEHTVARMEELAKAAGDELQAASTSREAFVQESLQLQAQGQSVAESLRATLERLSLDKQSVDAFDERLQAMARAVDETDGRVRSVLTRDDELASMRRETDALGKAFAVLTANADELAQRQSQLDSLAGQLAQVDALGKRTASQHDSLLRAQKEIEAARGEIAAFHQAHAEATQLRDKLALDKASLDALGERAAAMLGRAPELTARLNDVLGKMASVESGQQSVVRLGELVGDLDAQLERVGERVRFVEQVEARVNSLHAVTTDVERKLADQLARRAEVESLGHLCDTLATHVVDVQQKLDGMTGLQARVQPLASQVSTMTQTLQRTQDLVSAIKLDEAAVHEQRSCLSDLLEQGKALAAECAQRLTQVRSVGDELDRASSLKEQVLAELARVQTQQLDALAQTDATEAQIGRAEALSRQLEQRHTQLLHSAEQVGNLEGRLSELHRHADTVERQIQALADRDVVVQAVKAEVDNIRQISSRSKADLQYVTEHHGDVAATRERVEELLGRLAETEGKVAAIESRRQVIDEVQARAAGITHLLDDIHANLEMLSEQRAVVDDVGEKLSRLDFTVQEAHNTLRALQRERELAERIERGIKALRARS
ncbi:MAG TPA: hypothetical protein VFZ28_11070, partial [Burkholderiaceae bacterium]|nr:hypothetical protein [Burkholderiaceae bacterium]